MVRLTSYFMSFHQAIVQKTILVHGPPHVHVPWLLRYLEETRGSPGKKPGLLVFPAFISLDAKAGDDVVSAEVIADSLVSARKDQLVSLWRKGLIKRFNPGTAGHLPTQFER